jgi:Holliday junction resolvase RusA-like endonuclease
VIAFTIPGEPVAFARSGGKGAIRFTPKRQRDFMALVKLAAANAMAGAPPIEGPVEMILRATYCAPVSWSKKKRDAAHWRTSKPDADNIAKIVADAINEIVYLDDSQVASLAVQKVYGPLAGVAVTVAPLDERGTQ